MLSDDAPSLKKADCGIAVEGASDAARTAADVVFLDEGLSTIITSIKVARQIFHRMFSQTMPFILLIWSQQGWRRISYIVLRYVSIWKSTWLASSVTFCTRSLTQAYLQMLSILILNETIRVDLIVFLAIFAEYAHISLGDCWFTNIPVLRQLPLHMTTRLMLADRWTGNCPRFGLYQPSWVSELQALISILTL